MYVGDIYNWSETLKTQIRQKMQRKQELSITIFYSLHELAHLPSAFLLKLFLGTLGFLPMDLDWNVYHKFFWFSDISVQSGSVYKPFSVPSVPSESYRIYPPLLGRLMYPLLSFLLHSSLFCLSSFLSWFLSLLLFIRLFKICCISKFLNNSDNYI